MSLTLLFAAANIIVYKDHNPYSQSVFQARLYGVQILKLITKVLIMSQAAWNPTGRSYLFQAFIILVYSFAIYRNSTMVDFSKLWVQVILILADSLVFLTCLFALFDNHFQSKVNFQYEICIATGLLVCIVYVVIRRKLNGFKNIDFKVTIHKLSPPKAHLRFLDMLSVVKKTDYTQKYYLSLYIIKEIKNLERLDIKTTGGLGALVVEREFLRIKVQETLSVFSKDDTQFSPENNKYLYTSICYCILLYQSTTKAYTPSLVLLIYVALQNEISIDFCLRIYALMNKIDQVEMNLGLGVAIFSIKRYLQHSLKETRKMHLNYAKSDFENFMGFNMIFKKMTDLVIESAVHMRKFWRSLLASKVNTQSIIDLKAVVFENNKNIEKLHSEADQFTLYNRQLNVLYVRYLNSVLHSPHGIRKVNMNFNKDSKPLSVSIEDIKSAFDKINNLTTKHFVQLSPNYEAFGVVLRASSNFCQFLDMPNDSIIGRPFFNCIVPEVSKNFMNEFKSFCNLAVYTNFTRKSENLLTLKTSSHYIKLAVYDFFFILGVNNEVSVLMSLWPIELSPLYRNLLVLYDSSNLKLKYLTEEVTRVISVDMKTLLNDEIKSTNNYKISTIWPQLSKPIVLKSLLSGHELRLKVEPKYAKIKKNSLLGVSDRENAQPRQSKAINYDINELFIMHIHIDCLEETKFQCLRLSLTSRLSGDDIPTIHSPIITNFHHKDSHDSSINEINSEESKFSLKSKMFLSISVPRYVMLIKAFLSVLILTMVASLVFSSYLFNRVKASTKVEMYSLEMLAGNIQGLTSSILQMMELHLIKNETIKWTRPLMSRGNISNMLEAFQDEEINRQEKLNGIILSQNTNINISTINNIQAAKISEWLEEGAFSVDLKLTDSLSVKEPDIKGIYSFLMKIDLFLNMSEPTQYLINRSVFESLSSMIKSKYYEFKSGIDSNLNSYARTNAIFVKFIYINISTVLLSLLLVVYRAMMRIYKLYSSIGILQPIQIKHFVKILSMVLNTQLSKDFFEEDKDLLPDGSVNSTKKSSDKTIDTGNTVCKETTDLASRRRLMARIGDHYKTVTKKQLYWSLGCLFIFAAACFYQTNQSDSIFGCIKYKGNLLVNLNELNMNLINLNLVYFDLFFDKNCAEICNERALTSYNDVIQNIHELNHLLMTNMDILPDSYRTNLIVLQSNFCDYYYSHFAEINYICAENPVLYFGFDKVILSVALNFKKFLNTEKNSEVVTLISLNAEFIYYIRRGLAQIVQQGMAERSNFMGEASTSQISFMIIIFFVTLVAMSYIVYKSVELIKRHATETQLFTNMLDSKKVREIKEVRDFLDMLAF